MKEKSEKEDRGQTKGQRSRRQQSGQQSRTGVARSKEGKTRSGVPICGCWVEASRKLVHPATFLYLHFSLKM